MTLLLDGGGTGSVNTMHVNVFVRGATQLERINFDVDSLSLVNGIPTQVVTAPSLDTLYVNLDSVVAILIVPISA